MQRSHFLLISAALNGALGIAMLFTPALVVASFGLQANVALEFPFRAMGATFLGAGVLNLLVRRHAGPDTLRAVLVFNIVVHLLCVAVDLSAVGSGLLELRNIAAGSVLHPFIGIGSLVYLVRMERAPR